jgi:hypothetical protein
MHAAHPGCSQVDLGKFVLGKERIHRMLVAQVQLGVGASDDVFRRHALRP